MSGDRAQVDVGVVTWNTADVTPDALRRLLDTDQGCDIRLLVRDNGSTDGTVEAVAARVPEAEIDADDRNLGFAAGMNRLIARSTAPWFLALNPDAWPEPGAVGRLVAAGLKHTSAGAVAPRIERPDATLEHSTHPFPSLPVALLHATGGRAWMPRRVQDWLMLEGRWNHDRVRWVDWAVGAALLLNRRALDDVGPFDEGFFMYAEDLEWCWRARRRGWGVVFEPSSVFRHVGNVSGARAYGTGRIEVETQSAYRFHRMAHGPVATAAYRAVSAVAAAELWARARARGDHGAAEHWARRARAHLARRPGEHPSGGVPSPGGGQSSRAR
ncbi:MAG TPA: glycosyltransferase family 2 protein [Acidimicrobiales bacterium]|nr:glycosyltransferase family 2 protein [Acidimicrobiales bacterium]